MHPRSRLFLLAAGLAAIGATGCSQPSGAPAKPAAGAAKEAPPSTPVRTLPARRETVQDAIPVTGSIAATETVELAPRISARVVRFAGREGTPVRRGQVVVEQDTIDLQSQLRSAEAAMRQGEAGIASARASLQTSLARLASSKTQKTLQSTTSDTAVNDAEQQLRSAQAQLELARRPQRTQEVAVAESAVAQAQANFDKAAQDKRRYAQLVSEGAAAQAQLDQYVTQERVAKAALDTALAQLDIARTGGREESVRQAESAVRRAEIGVRLAKSNTQQNRIREDDVRAAEAAVAQARAGVAQAEATLASSRASLAKARQDIANATLTSPIDGIISVRSAEIGQLIGPGAPALTIVTLDKVFFEAQVPETRIRQIRVGVPVEITVDALPDKTFRGRIARIYPSGSTASRTFTARVEIDNPGGALRPGMFARGSAIVLSREGVVVSKDAIVQTEEGKTAVFVVRDGRAERRLVTVGLGTAETVEIVSGVRDGESIVVAGQGGLRDGAPVAASEATPAASR